MPANNVYKLSELERNNIFKDYLNGESCVSIASKYNFPQAVVEGNVKRARIAGKFDISEEDKNFLACQILNNNKIINDNGIPTRKIAWLISELNYKKCNTCFLILSKTEFELRKAYNNRYYLIYHCSKQCEKNRKKKDREKNEALIKKRDKDYYLNNKERIKRSVSNYATKNREKINARNRIWSKRKSQTDINYRLTRSIRGRVAKALKDNSKSETTKKIIGCSIDECRIWLEEQWTADMSWENYGYNGWHIDHKTGIENFDLTDPDQLADCFHWTNLEPRWGTTDIAIKHGEPKDYIGNINKGSKILYEL